MAAVTKYARGSTIHFAATFTDANGDAYTPSSPKLIVSYPVAARQRTTKTINLSGGGSQWSADWNSGDARWPGHVQWTIYSSSPDPKIAKNGWFELDVNDANLKGV